MCFGGGGNKNSSLGKPPAPVAPENPASRAGVTPPQRGTTTAQPTADVLGQSQLGG